MDLKKLNRILMRVTAVLLGLVMLSTAMVTGRYARYISSASGEDSSRVAKFSVTETGTLLTSFSAALIPGGSVSRQVTVENDSEVTIDYTISVKNIYGLLPLEFTVTDDTDATTAAPFIGTLKAGETATFTLNVVWPETEVDASYSGKVDAIEITLNTTQKD